VAAIPRGALPKLPSRHLGLVTANARNLSPQILDMLADAFEQHAMMEAFLKLADAAPLLYDDLLQEIQSPKGPSRSSL
jgi:cobyrinic acid a,c-diamide synthase